MKSKKRKSKNISLTKIFIVIGVVALIVFGYSYFYESDNYIPPKDGNNDITETELRRLSYIGEEQEWYVVRRGSMIITYEFTTDCSKDKSVAFANFSIGRGELYGKFGQWDVGTCDFNWLNYDLEGRHRYNFKMCDSPVHCEILSSDSNSANIKCEADCNNEEIKRTVKLFGYFSQEGLESYNRCLIEGGEYALPGRTIVCSRDGIQCTCKSDGEWSCSITAKGTTYPKCPA